MRDTSRETVTIGWTFGTYAPGFVHSMLMLQGYDAKVGGRHLDHQDWLCTVGTTNIAQGRNSVVRAFLASPSKPDWLLFIDTDQTFTADLVDRMVASADPVERPILSALIMGHRTTGSGQTVVGPCCAMIDENNVLRGPATIPAARHWPIPLVGTGCVIIHRTVLEAVGAEWSGRDPYPWFTANMPWRHVDPATGAEVLDHIGEDYAFCLRAAALGFPAHVDTTIEVGHVKTHTLTTADFWSENPTLAAKRWDEEPAANVVVIPFKDKWSMTRSLVEQLLEQGSVDRILLYNNGSELGTTGRAVAFAAKHDTVTVIDAKGLGIHEMWNAGAEVALTVAPKVNVCFLNNDLRLGGSFLNGLDDSLRSEADNLVAVCPNYDDRRRGEEVIGVERLSGICANRYDGTGGLSGFAFMVKGEWFQTGWRFPEDAMWWYGDNLLTMAIDAAGGWYGMVHGVTVEHLDGGGQTGDGWVDYDKTEQGQRDREAFIRHAEAMGYRVEVSA